MHTMSFYKYTHSVKFMQAVVRVKALELQKEEPETAAIMADLWKDEMVNTLLDECTPSGEEVAASPDVWVVLRFGVFNLLAARAGLLDKIVSRVSPRRAQAHAGDAFPQQSGGGAG